MLTTTVEDLVHDAATADIELSSGNASDWTHALSTTAGAAHYCHSLAMALNASAFSMLSCGPSGETRRLVPICDSEFPTTSTLSHFLSAHSCNVSDLLATRTPAWWRQPAEPCFLAPDARRWAREVEWPVEGTSGIAFPVSVERGRSGVVIFTGSEMAVDEVAMGETHARCHGVFASVTRYHEPSGGITLPLMSKREIECLRLTASGMTSEEIATALGLSVHTANQYLTNSTQKLDAVNRIHAVAKALRCGLID